MNTIISSFVSRNSTGPETGSPEGRCIGCALFSRISGTDLGHCIERGWTLKNKNTICNEPMRW